MADNTTGNAPGSPFQPGPAPGDAVPEPMDEAECLKLITPGGVGRLAYHSRYRAPPGTWRARTSAPS
jgi:hypothetical protein